MSGSFALDIQRFIDKADDKVDLVIRKVALDVFRRVIMKSPVDTGRFKSNWQVGIGNIPDGVLALDPKGDGTASMSRVTAAALNFKQGEIIHLVNNLPYARALEYGHSKQAPEGMVRITVREFDPIVKKAASEAKSS